MLHWTLSLPSLAVVGALTAAVLVLNVGGQVYDSNFQLLSDETLQRDLGRRYGLARARKLDRRISHQLSQVFSPRGAGQNDTATSEVEPHARRSEARPR